MFNRWRTCTNGVHGKSTPEGADVCPSHTSGFHATTYRTVRELSRGAGWSSGIVRPPVGNIENIWGEASTRSNLRPGFDASQVASRPTDRAVDPGASGERYLGNGSVSNPVTINNTDVYSQRSHGVQPKTTLEPRRMDPAAVGAGVTEMQPVLGAYGHSSSPMEVPGSIQPLCPPSSAQVIHQLGMDVQSSCAPTQGPVTQGDQGIGHKWVQNPSSVSGLSLIPLTPDVGQDGFNAEARGTSHTIDIAKLASCVTEASTPTSERPSQASDASAESQLKRPLFKLDKYNGSTSLDTYLWKFHQLAKYMWWSEPDKFINLCSSLIDPASQVLRELSANPSTKELESLLQTRFGTAKQEVSFQAKLRARHRKEGETLQELHSDISRLVQLAHPKEPNSLLATVGVNAFISALDDEDLEFEILKLEPQNLPDAVDHAIRLESLAESVRARPHSATDKANGRVSRQRHILAVTDDKKEKDKDVDLQL